MSIPILQFIPHFPPWWAPLVAQLVKNPTCNTGDLRLIPGLGRSPGEGKYSGLENSMDCIDHGVTKSQDTFPLGTYKFSFYICDSISVL